ncbi:type IV secretory system conjugative DNA transfer family protein [Thermogemmatispora sp.]|jgi:type IV secretion system protein VirD4|uniref:type IV secretory system conjugative DNA transfer family protein n=1 Tax=Thermogemmatispora sp. TaxID=1968838 RepID=UPI0035E420D7
MKTWLLAFLALFTVALIAIWQLGLLDLAYRSALLSLAFLTVYLPDWGRQSLGVAWAQWWNIGLPARWVAYESDPTLQRRTQELALLMSFALVALLLQLPWRSGRMLRTSRVHGSAHWATLWEARSLVAYLPWTRKARRESQLPLGYRGWVKLTLKERQLERHVIVIGPTGAGKTAGLIIPALLSERGQRSLFIIDPKSELVRLTAGVISQRMTVWVFAPTASLSHRYNPLAWISSMEDAETFALCWVQNTGLSNDPFWDRCAYLMITAAVLHLRHSTPEVPPLASLVDLLCGSSFEELQKTLLTSPSANARAIVRTFLKSLELSEKTAAGVMTDLASRFFWLSDPRLRTLTASNDLDFVAMTERNIALYMSIPATEAERLQPLSACLLTQMFATILKQASKQASGKLPRGVTCYLDEFANAGKVPHIGQYVTMLRSTGVGLFITVQNFAHLDSLYGKEIRETILANAATHIILPGVGHEEAKVYAERIGQTTAIARSVSRGSSSDSEGEQEIGRWLILPAELRTMKEAICFSEGLPPIRVRLRPYYRSRLKRLAGWPFPSLQASMTGVSPDGSMSHQESLPEPSSQVSPEVDRRFSPD